MCKHFHFWNGGLLFLQYCARVYKMKTCGGIITLHVSSLRLFNCISMKVCMGGQNTTLAGEFDVYSYHCYKMLKSWELRFPESCCWSFMAVGILRCSFWNTLKLPQQVPNGVNEAWITLLYPSWLLSFMWPTHPRCLGVFFFFLDTWRRQHGPGHCMLPHLIYFNRILNFIWI